MLVDDNRFPWNKLIFPILKIHYFLVPFRLYFKVGKVDHV